MFVGLKFRTGLGMKQTKYSPPETPLDIVYEDSDILVVNKPEGLLSVPGRGPDLQDCLLSRIHQVFPMALLVHRLDCDTSGLIVFAMNRHSQRQLSMQFEKRLIKKTYIARVWGHVIEKSGIIDDPIIVDWPNRPLQKICHETGKPAMTNWRCIRTGQKESRLKLNPKTGRSHQLRVHCKAIGHVILGDPLYAQGEAANYDRLMLHSEELRLNHPESGRGMSFRSKAPF